MSKFNLLRQGKRQVFIVWFIIFLAWSIFRAKFFLPESIDEFLIKPLIFAGPIIYLVLIKERKSLYDLGFPSEKVGFIMDLFIGFLIGVIFALEGMLANYLKDGRFSFAPILASKVSGGVLMFFIINLSTSIWEEILGRGFIYNRLYKATNNQFWSSFSSSYLFVLLHIPILFTRLHLTGVSMIVYPISIFLLGITNCYIFTLRKNSIVLPVLIHTFWNMTVALFL